MTMMKILGACVLSLAVAVPASAQRKTCDELKAEIAAKLDAKGVKDYQLEIVANAEAGDRQVVGSCDGGTKKITYKRGGTAPANPPK